MQCKNSDRKAAITNGTYIAGVYADEEAAKQSLKDVLGGALDRRMKKLLKAARESLTAKHDAHIAQAFWQTRDQEAAAGLIRFYCRHRGVQSFRAFISALQCDTPDLPADDLPWDLAKLRMLVTGFYKGQRMFQDELIREAPTEDAGLPSRQHWRPTRRNVYRILNYFVGMASASETEFCQLFPTFAPYIQPFFRSHRS